jgi:hypothetical protein
MRAEQRNWRNPAHTVALLWVWHAERLTSLFLQSLIPVVMSGIIAVYGLVISVLIAGDVNPAQRQSLYKYV